MGLFGLLLLLGVLCAGLFTGLPAYALLLAASVIGAAAGIAAGVIEPALLGALPLRLVGLFEHDLLQAVPLFALTGSLLEHLGLATLLYGLLCRALRQAPAAAPLAALGVATGLAPMNGSVAAGVAMIARTLAPKLSARGIDGAPATALVCAASTLGVLVPPSLVLLLLGDALMRAHTEAQQLGGHAQRIVNTQDVMHAALWPAAILLVLWAGAAVWGSRRCTPPAAASVEPPTGWRDTASALAVTVILILLLGGVAAGYLYAVEAAATGGVLLALGAWVGGRLSVARIRLVLHDALVLTGSLFALFVAATTFTLVLRGLGTDRLLQSAMAALPGGPYTVLAAALVVIALCALVLDAFEMIFVVLPILMPPVLARVDDAAWAGVLVLLALQLSFLIPPTGYAVMMAGARLPPVPTLALVRALAPYLLAGIVTLSAVAIWPALVHPLRTEVSPQPLLTDHEVERAMRQSAPRRGSTESP